MEDEVLKEKNEQKRKELLKEAKVRDYIKSSPLFQNLFNLPVRVSLEAIVERYAVADAHNMSDEITEEILSGIHKSIVDEITNEPNGVVLNPDGSINRDASIIEERRLEEEEKSKAFYRDSDKKDPIEKIINIEEKKERYTQRDNDLDEFIKKYMNESQADLEAKAHTDPNTFNLEKAIETTSRVCKEQPQTPEAKNTIRSVVEMNAALISQTKHHGFTAEMYRNLSFEHKYLIKRNLLLELITSEQPKDLINALVTIIPGYKDVSLDVIRQDLYSQLSSSDNVKKLLLDKEPITEPDGLAGHNKENFKQALQDVRAKMELYKDDGSYDFSKVKDIYEDDYVGAMVSKYKKNLAETILFGKVDSFEKNKKIVLSIYKGALVKEAEKIDPSRKDDPEFWKTIVPKKGSILEIINEQIKSNSTLFLDYMDGRLDIDFQKLGNVELDKNADRYLSVMETGMRNADKIENSYPKKRDELKARMINIKDHPNKEFEISEIKAELRKIPRELLMVDFFGNKEFEEYAKENDPNLEEDITKKYNTRIKSLSENKKVLIDAQHERLKELEKKDDRTTADEESKYAGSIFLDEIRSGKIDERLERQEEIDAKIAAARMQKLKKTGQLSGKYKLSSKTDPKVREKIKEAMREAKENTTGGKKTLGKGISKAIPLSQFMAKPKMIIDEIEIPVGEETVPEKTTNTFETLLKEQGLIGKFKAMNGDLTMKEYASKMSDIILSINEKIKDGSLPKEININGSVRETTLKDIVKMNFENTDILFENLPEDISSMSKEDIEKAIKEQLQDKQKEELRRRFNAGKNYMQGKKAIVLENENEGMKEAPSIESEAEVAEPEVKNEEEIESNEPSQDELQARLMQQQRAAEEEAKKKAKEQVQEVVEEAKTEAKAEVKEEKPETAIAKDSFFNRVKRGFLNNKVVKKFTELFGKKEENAMVDSAVASSSNNSKPVTKDEDHWGVIEDKNAAARKALEEHEANKQKEAEKVKVGVVEGKEENFEIGDE